MSLNKVFLKDNFSTFLSNVCKFLQYSMFEKDGLHFVRLYFLNYTWYVHELHNI